MPRRAALLLAAVAAGRPAAAQQAVGTISGRVLNAASREPIANAYVEIGGAGTGTLTAENGRYTLRNLRPGQYALSVRRIGYQPVTDSATVQAGGAVTLDFTLRETALSLDEVVVTGEAGTSRRREVGNAISSINMADVIQPAVSTEDLMQSRATGLNITQASGGAGGGSYIRLRGNVSMSQSNFPLLYVDGVRMRSEPYPTNESPISGRGNASGVAMNPINTINPDEIDRIEVIKGPAATTLYGTEASAGVIQIFTKRGARGAGPQWTALASTTMDHMLQFGTDSSPYLGFETAPGWLRNAFGHSEELSARGGGGDVQYFLSGQYRNADGVLPNDHIATYALRGNLGFQASRTTNVEWNTSLSRQQVENTSQTNSSSGFPLNIYRGTRNYISSMQPDSLRLLLDYRLRSDVSHLVTGLTLRFEPTSNFTHRLTAGYDASFVEHRQVMPFGYVVFPMGIVQDQRWSNVIVTLDYAANLNWKLTGSLRNTLSAGGQVVQDETDDVVGWAQGFAGPGEPTVSGGASQVAQENRIKVINAGFFFENRLSVADELFVTAGLRVDGNSAFGQSLGLQPYPKLSMSYILSDASFWKPSWGTVKLRAAWGQAGRAPGAFDAVKTWQAARYEGSPGFLPQNLGNPTLGPERTSEAEVGMDASFINHRLSTEVTYYYRRTAEALFPVRQPPSTGDWSSQLDNVGKLENRGLEVSLRATPIDNPTLGLDLGVSVSTNHSKVLDLGGASSFQVGDGPAYVFEGEPAPVVRGFRVTNPDEIAEPIFALYNYGPAYPTTILGQNVELRFHEIVLSARGEFQGGHWIYDRLEEGDVGRNTVWAPCWDIYKKIAAQGAASLTAAERHDCVAKFSPSNSDFEQGDFWKLRNVSLRVPLNFVAARPSLTLSAQNALKWIKMKYLDPEMAGQRAQIDAVRAIRDNIPPPATFSVSLKVNF